MYTGCGASKDVLGALELLLTLVNPDKIAASKTPRPIKARALSLQGRVHFDSRFEKKDAINIDNMYRAAVCANAAAALGFVSPDVLQVAQHVENIGFRRPEDNKFKEHSTERFEKLTDLWEAWDRRKAMVQREEGKQAAKVEKQPNMYTCAAEHCGIESTSKSGLSACGGKCPPIAKPSYCSKECQKKVRRRCIPCKTLKPDINDSVDLPLLIQDWKRHRPFCKAELSLEELEVAIEQLEESSVNDEETSSPPSNGPVQFYPDGVNASGKEHSVQIQLGDRPMKMSSTTMNPEFMKEFRGHLESRIKESQAS